MVLAIYLASPVAAQAPKTQATRKVALLMGVNNYENRNLTPLKYFVESTASDSEPESGLSLSHAALPLAALS